MSGIGGIRAALPATALAVVPRAVTPVAPVPPRRRGGAPIGDTIGPEDAVYTIINDPPAGTLAGPRRARPRQLTAGAPPRARASRAGWRPRLHGDALQAYAPYQDYLGLYVDLWV